MPLRKRVGRAGSSPRDEAVTVPRFHAPFSRAPGSAGSGAPRVPASRVSTPTRVPARLHSAQRRRVPLAHPVTVSGPAAYDPPPPGSREPQWRAVWRGVVRPGTDVSAGAGSVEGIQGSPAPEFRRVLPAPHSQSRTPPPLLLTSPTLGPSSDLLASPPLVSLLLPLRPRSLRPPRLSRAAEFRAPPPSEPSRRLHGAAASAATAGPSASPPRPAPAPGAPVPVPHPLHPSLLLPSPSALLAAAAPARPSSGAAGRAAAAP